MQLLMYSRYSRSQALPGNALPARLRLASSTRCGEAELREQTVPRQSLGTRQFVPFRVFSWIILSLALWLFSFTLTPAQDSFTPTAEQVNKKLVKIFGAGGFKGMPAYGTG